MVFSAWNPPILEYVRRHHKCLYSKLPQRPWPKMTRRTFPTRIWFASLTGSCLLDSHYLYFIFSFFHFPFIFCSFSFQYLSFLFILLRVPFLFLSLPFHSVSFSTFSLCFQFISFHFRFMFTSFSFHVPFMLISFHFHLAYIFLSFSFQILGFHFPFIFHNNCPVTFPLFSLHVPFIFLSSFFCFKVRFQLKKSHSPPNLVLCCMFEGVFCGRGACSLHFLSCSFHLPFIFLLFSFQLPSWFLHFPLISIPAFSWSTEVKPQPPKACSMFHVPSCLFLEGVQFPFIFSSCCFHFSVLFLSSSFHVVLSVLSLSCHCPFVILSSSSLVLSFSSHFNSRFQLKHWSETTTPKSMFYVPCSKLSFLGRGSVSLQFLFMLFPFFCPVPVIFLSCSSHCPFIVLTLSFCYPFILLIGSFIFLSIQFPLSAEALKWSHNPQKHVLCSMFQGVFSWKRLSFPSFSLHVASIFLSCCFHLPFMFFSLSFHCPVIVLLFPFHLPPWWFQGPAFSWSTEVKPQPPKACSMFHVPSCLFLEGAQFPSFSLHVSSIFLSCSCHLPFMFFSLSFHLPFIFLLFSFQLPSWFFHFPLISIPAFSWSTEVKPQPPKACSMFHVPSCLFLEGAQFPFSFSSCCFDFSVLFLSSSFHVLLIVLSLSCHCPFVSLSSPSVVISRPAFSWSTEVKPQPSKKTCSMLHVPSCLFLEGVQFPFIFSSCCFHFSVLFLSCSAHFPFMLLSFTFIFHSSSYNCPFTSVHVLSFCIVSLFFFVHVHFMSLHFLS